MEQIFLTISEAAKALRLNVSYVYKLAQAGEIPGVHHFGRAVRVHRESLESWAREQAQEGGNSRERELEEEKIAQIRRHR